MLRSLPLLLFVVARAASAEVSPLWGKSGELWASTSRLPDFSFAGYRAGDAQIPNVPVSASVKDYGAVGDGIADDTAAFIRALQEMPAGALLIPAGRYKLTAMLKIDRSGVVVRGEGIDKTALFFPKSLTEAVGPGKDHAPGNSWSWSGGFLTFQGRDVGRQIAEVTAPASRGDKRLAVASTAALQAGQWIRLVLKDPDGSLARHLHADQQDGAEGYRGRDLVDFASPIESIDNNTIVLKRPLRTDVRLTWAPAVYRVSPTVEDVGVEDLAIEFPETKYAGHHDEPGYNAVDFEGVSNGWVRRVEFMNADSGIFFRARTKFCTVESVRFAAGPGRMRTGYGSDKGESQTLPVGGHHGILMDDYSSDNLIFDFQLDFRFIHDTGVSAWAAGNVYSRGRGVDMDFDHHRRGPYENLFTQIAAGEGTRLWEHGGDDSDGPPSGARETFWNVRTDKPQTPPSWADQANFIGVTASGPSAPSKDGNWWESDEPANLLPANLYEAQRARRLSPAPTP
jgi:pectate lyase-like protein